MTLFNVIDFAATGYICWLKLELIKDRSYKIKKNHILNHYAMKTYYRMEVKRSAYS